jgi:hypothetical protein
MKRLFERLKKLRDKKFGHSDSHEINNPFKIEGFKGDQILEMKRQVELLLKVFNNILLEVKGSSFILHNDNRTANFIRYQAVYKKYYYDNLSDAWNRGYKAQ